MLLSTAVASAVVAVVSLGLGLPKAAAEADRSEPAAKQGERGETRDANQDKSDAEGDEKETRPEQSNPQANRQLWRAAHQGQLDQVNQALENGADVNAAAPGDRTALMLAGFNGHLKVVKRLIEAGANVNHADSNGRTALMYAATGPYPKVVRYLLKHGAKVNLTDGEEGFTALMFAGAEGNAKVVKALLGHDADPTITDKDGDTARKFAANGNHSDTAALLKAAESDKEQGDEANGGKPDRGDSDADQRKQNEPRREAEDDEG